MIAALTLLSFATLLLAVVSCLALGLLLLWWVIFAPWGSELDRDQATGYAVPPPTVSRPSNASRQCPQWILVASGKAVRRV